jgi:hypothetical protein
VSEEATKKQPEPVKKEAVKFKRIQIEESESDEEPVIKEEVTSAASKPTSITTTFPSIRDAKEMMKKGGDAFMEKFEEKERLEREAEEQAKIREEVKKRESERREQEKKLKEEEIEKELQKKQAELKRLQEEAERKKKETAMALAKAEEQRKKMQAEIERQSAQVDQGEC